MKVTIILSLAPGILFTLICRPSSAAGKKLSMALYYESQCPDCDGFIANDVYPVWKKIGGDQYLDIEFIPYGNAQTQVSPGGSITITCQHGPEECKGNVLHNCALKYISTKSLQIAFIACTFISKNPSKAGIPCSKLLKIDFTPIAKCTESTEGRDLHYLAGNRTNALTPPHQYVPWIIFNGVYNQQEMDESQIDFLKFICYKLTTMGVKRLPVQCKQQTHPTTENNELDDDKGVYELLHSEVNSVTKK